MLTERTGVQLTVNDESSSWCGSGGGGGSVCFYHGGNGGHRAHVDGTDGVSGGCTHGDRGNNPSGSPDGGNGEAGRGATMAALAVAGELAGQR